MVPFHPHFTSTLLRHIYNNSLYPVNPIWLTRKKNDNVYQMAKELQFEETEQTSWPNIAGMLELSD